MKINGLGKQIQSWGKWESLSDILTGTHGVDLLVRMLPQKGRHRVQIEQAERQLDAGGEKVSQKCGAAHQPTPSS